MRAHSRRAHWLSLSALARSAARRSGASAQNSDSLSSPSSTGDRERERAGLTLRERERERAGLALREREGERTTTCCWPLVVSEMVMPSLVPGERDMTCRVQRVSKLRNHVPQHVLLSLRFPWRSLFRQTGPPA